MEEQFLEGVILHGASIDFANEAGNDESEFVRVAPYCDAPQRDANGAPVVQRFDRESADALVSQFKQRAHKLLARLGFVRATIPFFNGHPDFANSQDEARDNTIYAEATALEARADGLYAKITRSPLLSKLKDALGRLEISPRWLCARDGDVMKPFELLSFGLVKNGNLPNADFINEKKKIEKEEEEMFTQEQIDELKQILGIGDTKEITPDVILAALRAKKNADDLDTENADAEKKDVKDEEEEKKEEKAESKETKEDVSDSKEKDAAPEEKDVEKKKKDEELDAANAVISAQRAEIATLLLDRAEERGRITHATRTEFEHKFAADFSNARAEFDALPEKAADFSNEAATQAELAAQADEQRRTAREQFGAMIQMRIDDGSDYSTAVNEVFATEEGRKLHAVAFGNSI